MLFNDPSAAEKMSHFAKNEALSISTIVSKNWYSSLYLRTFSLVWSGEGLCDSYLETFEEMLKPLSVDTNYYSVGTNLALILPSLVVGYISDCSLTLKLRGWWSKNLLSLFTPCLCSPDDDYEQERQGGSSTTSLSRGGCSWSSLGHLLSIPRLHW